MPQLILERIDLLGNVNLRCLSVIKVEGSHSYKAITFIRSKGNPRNTLLETKTYSKLPISLLKVKVFSKNTIWKTRREYFDKQLGDERWIK